MKQKINYLKSDNFNTHFKNQLNELFDIYDYKKKPYVVFDFDDTISIFDSQNTVVLYQLLNRKFMLNPKEFKNIILKILNPSIFNTNLGNYYSNHSFKDLFDDVNILYEKVWFNQDTNDEFDEFCVKMLHFFEICLKLSSSNEITNITKLGFLNFSEKEALDLCKNGLNYFYNKNDKKFFKKYINNSKLNINNIGVDINSNFYIPNETIELINVLHNNNFDIYICSASFYTVIKAVVENPDIFGINNINGIFAIKTDLKNEKFILDNSNNFIATYGNGKSKCIEKFLLSKYNQGPTIVFGDSVGDFHMLTEFKDTKLSVIFNKSSNDDMKLLIKCAKYLKDNNISIKDTYDNDTYFVLQGKDFNNGTYINSDNSIKFKSNKLEKDDFEDFKNFISIKDTINSSKIKDFKGYKAR